MHSSRKKGIGLRNWPAELACGIRPGEMPIAFPSCPLHAPVMRRGFKPRLVSVLTYPSGPHPLSIGRTPGPDLESDVVEHPTMLNRSADDGFEFPAAGSSSTRMGRSLMAAGRVPITMSTWRASACELATIQENQDLDSTRRIQFGNSAASMSGYHRLPRAHRSERPFLVASPRFTGPPLTGSLSGSESQQSNATG